MEFSRQKYWLGLPFPSPGDLPNPRIKPGSPALQADSLLSDLTVAYLQKKWPTFFEVVTVDVSIFKSHTHEASQVALVVKDPAANTGYIQDMQVTCKMQVQFLGQEDPLEEGTATHSSILVRRTPRTRTMEGNPRGARRATVHGIAKIQTWLSI